MTLLHLTRTLVLQSTEFCALKICFSTAAATLNHYKTLGIQINATQKEIEAAYLKLAPSLMNNHDQSRMNRILEAYEVLSDEESKVQYDSYLNGQDRKCMNDDKENHDPSLYVQEILENVTGKDLNDDELYQDSKHKRNMADNYQWFAKVALSVFLIVTVPKLYLIVLSMKFWPL